jgi:hypothetical protein
MATDDTQPEDKRPVGRPLKFETIEQLDLAIQNYFADCDPHTTQALVETGRDSKGNILFDTRAVLTEQKPYTMSGLARALGISRQALLDYSEREEFLDSIAMAKQRCEEYAESQLYGPYANGAKFNLINNYRGKHQDWAERQVVAGDPEAPLANPLASLTADDLRKLAQDSEPDGDPASDQD